MALFLVLGVSCLCYQKEENKATIYLLRMLTSAHEMLRIYCHIQLSIIYRCDKQWAGNRELERVTMSEKSLVSL